MSNTKEVSIIIPVLNQKDRIEACLTSILKQQFDLNKVEIIVIDNGSTDGTWEYISSQSVYVYKIESPKSPYICRNKGAELASGQSLLFLDANIILPHSSWLTKLLAHGTQEKQITVTKIIPQILDMTITQWCEIIAFFRYNQAARLGKNSLIVNLLVNKNTFFEIGLFEETRSGGDTLWIKNALKQNYHLKLAPDLHVFYQPKKWSAYLKKMARIGYRNRKLLQGFSALNEYWKVIWSMRPPNPLEVYKLIKTESLHKQKITWYLKVLFVMWFFRVYQRSVTLGILNPESD